MRDVADTCCRFRSTSSQRRSSSSPCSTGTRPSSLPNERFAYCNGGFVVLALLAERASGVPFHELVRQRVCEPAGMDDTEFLRSDELPGARRGRVPHDRRRVRTNVFHLPVRGQRRRRDLHDRRGHQRVLAAFFAGRIVSTRLGRRDGAASQRRAGEGRGATASASGSTPRATSSCSKAPTPASRSAACTTTRRASPHRDLEHVRWRVADRTAHLRAARDARAQRFDSTRRARCIRYSPRLSGFAVVRRRVGWSPLTGW